MSYKAAIAGLNLGGGKAVIIGDSKKNKNEILFRSFGRFVQGLAGRYITPEDVSDAVAFLISEQAKWITGTDLVVDGGVLTQPSW